MAEHKHHAASHAEGDWRHSVLGGPGGPRPTVQAQLSALAERQWGVLTQAQLVGLGLTRQTIQRWTSTHRLHRPYRGVYTLVSPPALAPQGQELAAVWSCGEDAVLCSVSAAVRWGLLRFSPKVHHVMVEATGRRTHGAAAIRRHVTADLPETDRTRRDGVPVTTVERTILDLAALPKITDRALESAAAQAEQDGWFGRPAQLRVAARARHRTGVARLRMILRVGPRLWRSDEEAAAAVALVAAGLPEPAIAHRIATDIGALEVDLSFPEHRLVLEVDGAQHMRKLNRGRDADRDVALDRAGWHVVRVTAALVRERPAAVVQAVRQGLAACGPGSSRSRAG